MDHHIQHDPRTKQNIKEALYARLYDPVQRDFKARLDALIVRNCVLMKYSHRSVSYKGTLYTSDPMPYPRKANRLSPTLYAEMDAYLAAKNALNNQEIPYVLGYINQVLNSSNDLCDYLDLLPSVLHEPIQGFIASCPCRTRHLQADEIQRIQQKNARFIDMMKTRMVTNLLL